MTKTKIVSLSLVALFLFSCASYRPVLEDNEQYMKVGESRAEADIDDCMARADVYLEKHKSDRMMKQAGRGAVSGAIVGGIMGALTGNTNDALKGAAFGGAVGAASGAAGEATKDNLKPDEMKQQYVAKCLERKKYNVIGWK